MKRQKRKLNPSIIFLIALFLVLIFIIKGAFNSIIEYFVIQEKVEEQNIEFKRWNEKKDILDEKKKIVESDKFYQEQLLDKYLKVRPGERVINLVE